ncbi:MAG: hypothetical protein AABZ13_03340, partial [Planctomycetota bacterium]
MAIRHGNECLAIIKSSTGIKCLQKLGMLPNVATYVIQESVVRMRPQFLSPILQDQMATMPFLGKTFNRRNTMGDDTPKDLMTPDSLKQALKPFRKRLRLTRLDAESRLGGGALTGGKHSGIVAIRPPNSYPKEVWEELVKQGKLRH